jgi:HD-GYP domain-containing protein (c-di-GMP phosphodiesterase class II)
VAPRIGYGGETPEITVFAHQGPVNLRQQLQNLWSSAPSAPQPEPHSPSGDDSLARLHRIRRETLRLRQGDTGEQRLRMFEGLIEMAGMGDADTAAHAHRVGELSAEIAEAMGWEEERVSQMRIAATLHDIGKIGVPRALLFHAGRLSEEEIESIRGHAEIGHRLLSGSDHPVLRMARDIAHAHHERWDGTGYPRGLSGEEIPAEARVVAAADAYDVMRHDRAYQSKRPHEDAMRVLEDESGTHFDPAVTAAMARIQVRIRAVTERLDEELAPGAEALPARSPRPPGVSR